MATLVCTDRSETTPEYVLLSALGRFPAETNCSVVFTNVYVVQRQITVLKQTDIDECRLCRYRIQHQLLLLSTPLLLSLLSL